MKTELVNFPEKTSFVLTWHCGNRWLKYSHGASDLFAHGHKIWDTPISPHAELVLLVMKTEQALESLSDFNHREPSQMEQTRFNKENHSTKQQTAKPREPGSSELPGRKPLSWRYLRPIHCTVKLPNSCQTTYTQTSSLNANLKVEIWGTRTGENS